MQLAEFTEVAHRRGGIPGAVELARRRAEKQFDPHLVEILCADADKVFHDLDETESWDAVLDAEPALSPVLSPAECDEALVAISRFVDLKSPYTIGHSVAVAELVCRTRRRRSGASSSEITLVRRAALVSRYGCLGVSNGIWDKRRPLSSSDWERIRLHPYLTERMLQHSPALAGVGGVAVQLRERLDGSGYPRGLTAATIARPARLLAAADVYQAMLEPRPHRPARAPDDAATSSEAKPARNASTLRWSKRSSVSPVIEWRVASTARPVSPAARSRCCDSSRGVVRTRTSPRVS